MAVRNSNGSSAPARPNEHPVNRTAHQGRPPTGSTGLHNAGTNVKSQTSGATEQNAAPITAGKSSADQSNKSCLSNATCTPKVEATPDRSGITDTHLKALKSLCAQSNVGLFLRPSTAATMRLIDLGYATKSTDVHQKSSNWGLMSGFVPCDAYFSKKRSGVENRNIVKETHSHGAAHPVQLKLTATAITTLSKANHFGDLSRISNAQIKSSNDQFEYYQDGKDKSKLFVRDTKSDSIYWQEAVSDKDSKIELIDEQVELMVWGYSEKPNQAAVPVTGDYDTWMICFPEENCNEPIHCYIDEHGATAATPSELQFIEKANKICNHTVFRHGTEARNTEFAQDMDDELVYLSPKGEAEMIPGKSVDTVLETLAPTHKIELNHQWLTLRKEVMNTQFTVKALGAVSTGANFSKLLHYIKKGLIPTDLLSKQEINNIKQEIEGRAEFKEFQEYHEAVNDFVAPRLKFLLHMARKRLEKSENTQPGRQSIRESISHASLNSAKALKGILDRKKSKRESFNSIDSFSSSNRSINLMTSISSAEFRPDSSTSSSNPKSLRKSSSSSPKRRSSLELEASNIHCRGLIYDTETKTLYPMVTSNAGSVRFRDNQIIRNENQGDKPKYKIIDFRALQSKMLVSERSQLNRVSAVSVKPEKT